MSVGAFIKDSAIAGSQIPVRPSGGDTTRTLRSWVGYIEKLTGSAIASPLAMGAGDAQQVYNAANGGYLDLKRGTAASPDASRTPLIKVTRTIAPTDDGGASDDGEELASVVGIGVATAAAVGQPIGVFGGAKSSATTTGTGGGLRPDAVGVYGASRITSSGTGVSIGGYFAGRRDNDTGKVSAVEIQCQNYGTLAGAYNSTGFSTLQAMWIIPAGNADLGAGIAFGNASGIQFKVGIGFTAQVAGAKTGGIADSSIRDDSSATRSIDIRGSHQYGIDLAMGTFSVAPIRLANGQPIYAINGAGTENHQLISYNSANIIILGASPNTASISFQKTLAPVDGVSMTFGTTTGTKIATAANQKLAFYGATPIIQQTGVAVTAGAIHAALVSLGLITS